MGALLPSKWEGSVCTAGSRRVPHEIHVDSFTPKGRLSEGSTAAGPYAMQAAIIHVPRRGRGPP